MAQHLETVQWKVRPAGCTDGVPLSQELPVSMGAFRLDEVHTAIRKLETQRADSRARRYTSRILAVYRESS